MNSIQCFGMYSDDLILYLNGKEILIKNEHESPAKSPISLQAVQFVLQNSF